MNSENIFSFAKLLLIIRIHLDDAWKHTSLPVMAVNDIWFDAEFI